MRTLCVTNYDVHEHVAQLAVAARAPKVFTPLGPQHAPAHAGALVVVQPISHVSHTPRPLVHTAPPGSMQPPPTAMHPPSHPHFQAMYARLEAWASTYHSSHVPRHCFDAADLGAWVWLQRRLYRRGLLPQWQVDQLNRLGFVWSLSKQDAEWHANVHHLRQFRLLQGLSPEPAYDGQHGAWRQLSSWLSEQGMQMAAGRLPMVKQQTLAAVGVALRVDSEAAQRGVQLQGLNAHERRLIRKQWKAQDASMVDRGEACPVGRGDARPGGREESRLVDRGEARRVDRGEARPVGRHPAGSGDARPVDRGDARPVGREEARLVGRGEARRVDRGEARPVGRGDARPVGREEARPVDRGDALPGRHDVVAGRIAGVRARGQEGGSEERRGQEGWQGQGERWGQEGWQDQRERRGQEGRQGQQGQQVQEDWQGQQERRGQQERQGRRVQEGWQGQQERQGQQGRLGRQGQQGQLWGQQQLGQQGQRQHVQQVQSDRRLQQQPAQQQHRQRSIQRPSVQGVERPSAKHSQEFPHEPQQHSQHNPPLQPGPGPAQGLRNSGHKSLQRQQRGALPKPWQTVRQGTGGEQSAGAM